MEEKINRFVHNHSTPLIFLYTTLHLFHL
uniref:Uncharacterized protein n=1 Tax=Anguilla anguilla TaxID=7936 RepID=A0A0E9XET7_ANGAN